MLTPTVANKFGFFYPIGNTPATSLARCVPQGQDAAVLSLGCGDVRNILYTAYIDKGLPQRKLDFTCCDIDEKIIARNVLFLSLLHDGGSECTEDLLWNAYYHFNVDEAAVDVILRQAKKLLDTSETLDAWNSSVYGRAIKFCDADTLGDVRKTWLRVREAAEKCQTENGREAVRQNFQRSQEVHDQALGGDGMVYTGLRSAAPLSIKSQKEMPNAYNQYWKHGTVAPDNTQSVPNPLITGLLSESEILHYSSDPLPGYHLATAFAPLLETSPLRPRDVIKGFSPAAAAKVQFSQWVSAFRAIFGKRIVVRFVVADVYSFCHTLQHALGSGKTSANLYRRQNDSRILTLEKSYGKNGKAPKGFDMVDSSNLSDHFGALNMLVATAPLLRDEPWATVYTELLIKREGSQQEILQKVLCGHAPTVSLLLGVSPVQYWTNAKCESHVDEIYLGLMQGTGQQGVQQLHTRLAWKRDDHFSGQYGGRSKIHIEPKTLSRVILQMYLQMFEGENITRAVAARRDLAYPYFHRGSLAVLLKLVKDRVETDWSAMCVDLLDKIVQDQSLGLATNQVQDFCAQLHLLGVNTQPFILNEVKIARDVGGFHAWKSIPPVVAVTVQVPRPAIDRLYPQELMAKWASPLLAGSLRSSPNGASQWHNIFGAVQIVFGKVKETGAKDSDDYNVSIEQDKAGWSGTSSLVVSFYVPTASLQVEPKTALVGLGVPPTAQSAVIYGRILGSTMSVFETPLSDDRVFVSKRMPGQTAHPVVCGGVKPLQDMVEKGKDDRTMKLLVEVPASESVFNTITGHLEITSIKGKGLLKDKASIELRQQSPFIIDIVFGDGKLVCPLQFPIPVESVGSRTRIARKSGYIEVIAPIATAGKSEHLTDLIFPAVKNSSGTPATLNTPHLNMDNLPVLNVDDRQGMSWLTALTSFQFSVREKRDREIINAASGASNDLVLNFKESLFSMLMLSSGSQGGQTGLFALNQPDQGGIHMLILVSALRLDGDTASVVMDAAVLPLTLDLVASGKMSRFLLRIRELEICSLTVNDEELALWKKVLPSLVERCRTWSHKPSCEYKEKNATIPLSLEHGKQVLCSCGNGQLPDDFIGVPDWDNGRPHAVRIAISPTYAVPLVEEVADTSAFQGESLTTPVERCRSCGRAEGQGTTLKRCTRCKKSQYCSAECQRRDWKQHRMECEA